MGPFGKFTSKLKGQQKDTCKNGRQCSDNRVTLQREHDPNTQKLRDLGESKAKDDVDRVKVGKPDEKAQLKSPVGAGKEDNERELNLLKEPTWEIKKGTRSLRGDITGASTEGNEATIVKADKSGAGNAKEKARHWRDSKHRLSIPPSSEAPFGTASFRKIDEGKLEEKGASQNEVCATMHRAQVVASESSDLETSNLTRSLGLNRIKTRSGPLYEDSLEGENEPTHIESKPLKIDKANSTAGKDDKGNAQSSGMEAVACNMSDDVDRSKFELLRANCDVEKCNTRTDVPSPDQDLASGSLEGKNRRKWKADSQRPHRGYSGRRTCNEVVMPVIGQVVTSSIPATSTASQLVDGVHPCSKELSKIPMKPDNILEKRGPSHLLSYLDNKGEKTREVEVAVNQLDVIKETESCKFHCVPQNPESGWSKKWPKDIKSFSHELGSRGTRSYDVLRARSDNDLEELLADLRGRFNTAKEEVDGDLNLFAADLVEILDRNADPFPQWQENVEDLLLLARRCTLLSPCEFRQECESIVRDLDDQRQDLPVGLLKQLHTRMLFILTRCTRLLQFQKETNPDEEGFHKIQQCLKCVPSLERTLASVASKREKAAIPIRKFQTVRNDVSLSKLKSSKHTRKASFALEKDKLKNQRNYSPKISQDATKSSAITCECSETSGQHHNLAAKGLVIKSYDNSALTQVHDVWDRTEGSKAYEDDIQQAEISPSKQSQKTPWFYWTYSENIVEESDTVICRICEEEVRTSHLQPHSLRCALADACDVQGLNLDERLRMLADYLERIAELNTPKSNQTAAEESPDGVRPFKLNLHDGFDSASPQSNEKVIDSRFDDMSASDTASVEDLRGHSLISFKRLLGSKSDPGASSSAGSGTPRSALTTPRTSQIDLLWAERNSFTESEDISQIYELAGIARCIANKGPMEEGVLDYLESCLEELQEKLARSKIKALTVGTFGSRIKNLLREKLCLLGGDQRKVDFISGLFDDDGTSTDDGVQSFKSTPTHPSHKDRITIEDFEILKLISRGAFGRVFLARKRVTGDLFAIKVLRKIDMIRKNAVENILAERDILITVCNPFVVRFFYSFTCRDNLYLVMEYLNGGDLYSLMRHMGCLDEHVARVYIAELVLALEYLHSLSVVHRDLKPDNILIARDGHIKLTDFGLSKVGLINSTDDLSGPVLMEELIFEDSVEHIKHSERRNERSAVGTPDYLAPEILLGTEHGYTADWWSVGVILFECLTSVPPFNAEHPQIIFDNILNRKIPWPTIPEDMSYDAKDLIDKLLTEDPNQRLGAKGAPEVKNHPFFKDISWDTLARQKVAFVPSPESVDDTSYFTTRHHDARSSPKFVDSSDCSTSCSSSNSVKATLNEGEDECGDLADFGRIPSVEHTFDNFSFKNRSQLASINYDLLLQTGKDPLKGNLRNQSAS